LRAGKVVGRIEVGQSSQLAIDAFKNFLSRFDGLAASPT
jgi:hypothetical protein